MRQKQRIPLYLLILLLLPLLPALLYSERSQLNLVSSETLGGQNRYVTHLSTDKPIYRGGETVHIRGTILNAKNNEPLPDGEANNTQALLKIIGPNGNTVHKQNVRSRNSVLGARWTIPDEQSGGTYTCRIAYPKHTFPPASRVIDVRSYRTPRLKAQIEFLKDGYGPGDRVTASVSVTRAEGGVPEGASVTVIGRVGGNEIHRSSTTLDSGGTASARFQLPEDLTSSDGTLSFVIEDGGVQETKSRSIPIVLNNLDLSLYPEGGDLVAGLPNRVYVEARTSADKPVDLNGRLLDEDGNTVARLETLHEGRGRFSFTPEADASYRVSVDKPAGVSDTFQLPSVREHGVSLRSTENVTPGDEPVHLRVGSTSDRTVRVTLRKREDVVATKTVSLNRGDMSDVTLAPEKNGEGVLVATAYHLKDGKRIPMAERLLFRRPDRNLNIELSTKRDRYTPGDEVTLTVKTTDASGDPVPAVVGLTATDESVLEMKPDRQKAPRLRSMVYLESETDRLKDARIYLDSSNEEAPAAVDLLLGTQGWRRFAFHRHDAFLEEHGNVAKRVLAYEPEPEGLGGRGAVRDPLAEEQVRRFNAERAVPDQAARVDDGEKKNERQNEMRLRVPENDAEASEVAGRFANVARRYHREYAHRNRTEKRTDFTETVYWHAGAATGSNGTKTVTFELSDAITTFKVRADGFTRGGAIGQATLKLESVKPLYVEPKLPLHVTSGDQVHVPVAVTNNLDSAVKPVALTAESGDALAIADGDQRQVFDLDAGERTRKWVTLDVADGKGEVPFTLDLQSDRYQDQVQRTVTVEPRGFPADKSLNGVIDRDGSVSHTFQFPEEFVPGSLDASVTVYPSPLANLEDALASLIRRPTGCFEQASSTNYPMVMAQQYFQQNPGVDPELVARAKKQIEKGYKKLVGYETEQNGYEWFGRTPPHEALTAYGLLEFTDMQDVYDVDKDMIERTRAWLMNRRTGDGTFRLQEGGADSFGRSPENASQAYITWVLLETGETGLDNEVEHVAELATSTGDTYITALAARILWLDDQKDRARAHMKTLAERQTTDGWLDGAETSITRSGGTSLKIETTAFAALAWMSADGFESNVETATRWILKQNNRGQFGSTQSTIMALKAILAYNRKHAAPDRPGELQLYMDGTPVGDPVSFTPDDRGKLELPSFAHRISPGKHTISIRMTDGSNMPYSIDLTYSTPKPASAGDSSQTGIDVRLTEQTLAEGDPLEAQVTVTNRTDEEVHMPLAVVGLPGGLEPDHQGLKDLVRSGRIASYETMGRELVLYWRGMAAGGETEVSIPLQAAVPGTYTGPASRSYLYYNDEHKQWIDPIEVEITK
jgi:uncharacterized protein YfaS (alpha-2-macroglobulin family)